MLYVILITIILSIIIYGWGSLTSKLFNPKQFLSFTLIKGIFIIGTIAFISSFFYPLNIYFELIIICLGIALATYFKFWTYLRFSFKANYPYILLAIITCFVASMPPYIIDTFSYYLPTIKWLDGYGLVTGLANFDFNLGQNSLWHIIQASFNQTIDIYYKLNALLVCIFILYLKESNQKQFLIFLPLFYFFIASSSPDLAVFIFSCIGILNYLQEKNENSVQFGLILSSYILLIKPIAFSLLLFFGFVLIFSRYKKKYVLIFCSFLGVLFCLKNIVLSGNILFPMPYLSLNSLTHSLPNELYRISSIDGKYLVLSNSNHVDYLTLSNWNEFTYFKHILSNVNFKIAIYLCLALFHLFFLIYLLLDRNKTLIFLSILLIIKVIVIFYISIQYRFIIDNILIILCVLLYKLKKNYIVISVVTTFIFSLLLVFSNQILKKNLSVLSFQTFNNYHYKYLIKPENYSVSTKNNIYFNFKSQFSTSYLFSIDAIQPTLNKTLFYKYLNNGYHPEVIDSLNLSKGFKSIKNDSLSIQTIHFELNKKDQ